MLLKKWNSPRLIKLFALQTFCVFNPLAHSSENEVIEQHGTLVSLSPETTDSLMVKRFISNHGTGSVRFDSQVYDKDLDTKYKVKAGKAQDQQSSGRCWIFAGEKIISEHVREKWGSDTTFSHNYFAFWDKMERANFVIEKLIQYRSLSVNDSKIVKLVGLIGDGGEWEFFKNIVKKYGVVPDYVMPETKFSGNSRGYNAIVKSEVQRALGLIINVEKRQLSEGEKLEEFGSIKQNAIENIRNILVSYLGTPPQYATENTGEFYWKSPEEIKAVKSTDKKSEAVPSSDLFMSEEFIDTLADKAGADDCAKKSEDYLQLISPLELFEKTGVNLDDYIHIAHLPYHVNEDGSMMEGVKIEVEDTTNMLEGELLNAVLVSMEEIKSAVRRSIKDGSGVEIGCEMQHHDRNNSLLSIANDRLNDVLKLEHKSYLAKGERLVCGLDVIAHGMYLVGCDDTDKCLVEGGKPGIDCPEHFGPLWQTQNSWGKTSLNVFMTDEWFEEYGHSFILNKKYLSKELRETIEDCPTISVPSTDPFGQVTL